MNEIKYSLKLIMFLTLITFCFLHSWLLQENSEQEVEIETETLMNEPLPHTTNCADRQTDTECCITRQPQVLNFTGYMVNTKTKLAPWVTSYTDLALQILDEKDG